jgi:hypothetical protein
MHMTTNRSNTRPEHPNAQLPSSLRLEPLKLASGGVLQLAAGAALPESTAEVVNGLGQRLSRSFFNGHKQALRVVGGRQRGVRLMPVCLCVASSPLFRRVL